MARGRNGDEGNMNTQQEKSKSMESAIRNPQSAIGRILIADDEEIVHLTLKRLLEPEGYTVDSAYGGEEALRKLIQCGMRNESIAECGMQNAELESQISIPQSEIPTQQSEIHTPQSGYDLLILDIRMPDMDGIEVLREIRKREIIIEIFILTGYASLESATQATNYGVRGYLMKPIENIPEFKSKISSAIKVAKLTYHNKKFYEAIVSGQVDSITIDGKLYPVPTIREEFKEVFQRLMEVTRDAVVFLDFDGNVTFANVNFAQVIGESYQNLLGARFDSYAAEGSKDRIIEVITQLSSGQVAVSIPAQLKTSYGSFLSVIISASPIYYKTEYRGIALVITDVTEMQLVREKVELLANLVENAQYDMMFIMNPEGQIIECNSLATRAFGYPRSELLGLNIAALLKFDADEDWGKIRDCVERESNWRGDILAISNDRVEFPVEMTISKTAGDVNANIICFMRDITERKRADETKAQAQAQAQRIEQMERELRSLELLARPPTTAVTAQLFDAAPLSDSLPDTFDELVVRYGELLDQALEQRAYKVDYDISGNLRSVAEQMGFLKAGPRDVVKLHSTVLQNKTRDVPSAKARAYLEEGRVLVLELMGYLSSFYRNSALGAIRVSSPKIK